MFSEIGVIGVNEDSTGAGDGAEGIDEIETLATLGLSLYDEVRVMVNISLEPEARRRWLATMPAWVSTLAFPEDIETGEFGVELDDENSRMRLTLPRRWFEGLGLPDDCDETGVVIDDVEISHWMIQLIDTLAASLGDKLYPDDEFSADIYEPGEEFWESGAAADLDLLAGGFTDMIFPDDEFGI